MARSTWPSALFSPCSLACCSSARWVISRSSTCLSSTSAGGGWTFCCFNCCCTTRRAASSSYCVTASSLTTAITRSTVTTEDGAFVGCPQTPAANSTSAVERMGRMYMAGFSELREIVGDTGRAHRRLVARQVAGHAALEDIDRIGAKTCETVQLELHEYRVARLLRRRGQALPDNADRPAVAIVLEAQHPLQRLAIDQRVVPAADERPLVGYRPLPREVDLLQLGDVPGRIDVLTDVAIAGIEHLAGRGLPAHADVEQLRLRVIDRVLQRACRRPVIGQPAFAGKQKVGRVGAARRFGQRHPLALEIVTLSNREAAALVAGCRIEQPRGNRKGDLVGIADAIVAPIAVLGEQLRKIEVVDRGVERRNLVLPPVRNVDVERARLERLGVVAPEHVG